MDLCDKYEVPAELRYDNAKEESIHGTIMKRIMSNFYIIGRLSETYTQQQNNFQGKIRYLQYQSKRRMIQTNALDLLWGFCIVTEYEIISRMSIGG